ncbi:uncharacterized protein TNCV_1543071 [Trichonephila clavipes]|nr:uncharacterized protein TNCV_1543071 [Trichonephila clavipes]
MNSSAKVRDTQGYEKKHWSDNCPGSGKKIIQKFEREETGSFHVQSGRGRKRVHSIAVEEVTTAVQEELSGENPLATQPVPLHPEKVNVWCRFKASFTIGPYFFEETGAFGPVTVTVTGQRLGCLLRNHVIPDLQQRGCVNGIIFMQDGAPRHIANPGKQLLKGHLGNARVISHHFPTA